MYCETHSIQNLCVICWTENHSDCKVYPMARLDKKKEIIEQLQMDDEKNEEEILCKLAQYKLNIFDEVENQFQTIRIKFQDAIEERKKLWSIVYNHSKLLEKIPDDISLLKIEDFFLHRKLWKVSISKNVI
ncbi:unnamed protein product [Dimorphilus gyrociliatus]|uniref:Uncharacterized protein n=1 Tax=Dimorphilus gyrociliatus TaxID=2664684 RepID=A0A7I8WF88_9ANNE|nr:unnamed protein product [Dimorphilus gyrociliatus]